jgi:hypothetical protein
MVKNFWNKLEIWHRFIVAAVVNVWAGGFLCMLPVPGGLALAAFISAIILTVCAFVAKGDLK